jgi:hypothetical protein
MRSAKSPMKMVLISDTHGEHNSIQVPYGDILIHGPLWGGVGSGGRASLHANV